MRSGKKINFNFRRHKQQFLMKENDAGEGVDHYFTLSFCYEFEAHKDEEIWIAHSIPYTFTDMNKDLLELKNESFSKFIRIEVLTLSLGKLPVPVITITDNVQTYFDYAEELLLH